jgi:hypothetical protein
VALSWARAGREETNARIRTATILATAAFIYTCKFVEALLAASSQSFSNKSVVSKCYNCSQFLSSLRRLSQNSDWLQYERFLVKALAFNRCSWDAFFWVDLS